MKNLRIEYMTIGKDKWEISYIRDTTFSICIRVEVGLLRPNRKWYQFKYIETDYSYCVGTEEVNPINLRVRAQSLIAKYYDLQDAKDTINKFFEEDNKEDDTLYYV